MGRKHSDVLIRFLRTTRSFFDLTSLRQGGNLSFGQRQLLCLARMVLRTGCEWIWMDMRIADSIQWFQWLKFSIKLSWIPPWICQAASSSVVGWGYFCDWSRHTGGAMATFFCLPFWWTGDEFGTCICQESVQDTINHAFPTSTMLAVAHRLETIMEFDQAAWTVKGCSLGSVHVLQVLQVQVSKSIVEILPEMKACISLCMYTWSTSSLS